MAVTIDRRTVQYLSQQGVDLAELAGTAGGVIDEAELQQIEDTLAARPEGLDQMAAETVARLRALSGERDVLLELEEGRLWGVQIKAGLLPEDLSALRAHVQVTNRRITIGPSEFAHLRELATQPSSGVDAQLLSRLARLQGTEPARVNGYTVQVDAVPTHTGSLNADDIEYIRAAYRVPLRNGVLGADDYQAILRAVQRGGVSQAEAALLERIEIASLENARIGRGGNAVRIDISTPSARELSQFARQRNITNFAMPELFGELAQRRLSTAELALVRRLVASHGREVQVPGQSRPVAIDARLTGPELVELARRFGGDGLNLRDGVLDAQDLEVISAGLARAGATPAEREILLGRLLLAGGYTVGGVEGVGEVRVAPRDLTAQDIHALEDIYGVDLSQGVIRPDHLVDVMQQMSAPEIPRGLRQSLDTLARGQRVSGRANDVFMEQLDRRLAVLEQSSATRPEDAARAAALRERLSQIGTLPFSPQSPSDQGHLRFIEELLTDPRGGMDPYEQGLAMRLDGAHGAAVTLADGRRVQVNLEAEVEVRRREEGPVEGPRLPRDQEVHDRIIRDSRRHKDIDFRYEGGRFILTLSSEDEAAGRGGALEAQVRQDGRGGALRYDWNTSVPVHPDVWLGMQLGIGASYEQDRGVDGSPQHHIGLEATGGVNLRWYMNRRLGMRLDVEAHVGARAHFHIDQGQAKKVENLTRDEVQQLQQDAQARVNAYSATLQTLFSNLGPDTKEALQSTLSSEVARVSAELGPIMQRLALASLTGDTAAEQEAQQDLQNLLNGMMDSVMGAAAGAAQEEVQQLVNTVRTETQRLMGDLQSLVRRAMRNVNNNLTSPFDFGWGVTVGGSIGWQARIPVVAGRAGALYFAPNVRVYGEAPPVEGHNDQSLLRGMRDPSLPRIGIRAEAGFVFQPGHSPLGLYVGGGVDQSWSLGPNGDREALVPIGRAALQFRW